MGYKIVAQNVLVAISAISFDIRSIAMFGSFTVGVRISDVGVIGTTAKPMAPSTKATCFMPLNSSLNAAPLLTPRIKENIVTSIFFRVASSYDFSLLARLSQSMQFTARTTTSQSEMALRKKLC